MICEEDKVRYDDKLLDEAVSDITETITILRGILEGIAYSDTPCTMIDRIEFNGDIYLRAQETFNKGLNKVELLMPSFDLIQQSVLSDNLVAGYAALDYSRLINSINLCKTVNATLACFIIEQLGDFQSIAIIIRNSLIGIKRSTYNGNNTYEVRCYGI